LIASLASPRLPLWLDAGVSSVDRARRAVALGADRVVVGLETLPSYVVLEEICAAIGRDRVVFSVDLRDGRPVVRDHGIPAGDAVDVVAAHGADAGVGAVIVLDLARVGEGGGPDVEVIARVREAAPVPLLLAGGGVRGLTDLARLAEIGCDGALVATALLDGRLSAADVRMAAGYRNARR
jgi:phosphoribosylformimino-5-aminoimidazole carboxamide ribotide isomerase